MIGDDERMTSGECGAVTLGAVVEICEKREDIKKVLDIDENSIVILISTEGDTDPVLYNTIISRG